MKIRQTATTLDDIRDDHKERYKFAATQALARGDIHTVLDVGCGVGYGSYMLGKNGFKVVGVERNEEAFESACANYAHPSVDFVCRDLNTLASDGSDDMLTMFEIIEHTPDALKFIASAHAKLLVGSVPNEDVVPYVPGRVNPEHYRHFTPGQIREALAAAGWVVTYMGYQPGKHGAEATVQDNPQIKRTIVFVAERA